MLIRTMGLFWKREDVFWGKGGKGNKATLLGVSVKAKRDEPVNFLDQIGVYALYANYALVYIGQTGTGKKRLGSRLVYFGAKRSVHRRQQRRRKELLSRRPKSQPTPRQKIAVLLQLIHDPKVSRRDIARRCGRTFISRIV